MLKHHKMRAAQRAERSHRVLNALKAVVTTRWMPLEVAWSRECHGVEPNERSLIRDICSGTLRYLVYYDRLLEYVSPRVRDDVDMRLLAASTLYQNEQMTRAPTLEALSRAAAEVAPRRSNRMLVEACNQIATLSLPERKQMLCPASSLSLPVWLHRTLRREGPFKDFGALLLQRPDFLGLYVQPGSSDLSAYLKRLRRAGFNASSCALSTHGIVLHSRPRDVGKLPGILERQVHVQDAVQQYGASRLETLAPHERVLDACAAPGGKTRALLGYQPHASILAIDRDPSKVAAMRSSLSDRTERVHIECGDALHPATWWDGTYFGAIVLDAPCSATGLLRTRPEVKCHLSQASVDGSASKQLALLHALWPLLRPGGQLLYTTCSILDQENTGVIRTFLSDTRDADLERLEAPPIMGRAQAQARLPHRKGRRDSSQLLYSFQFHDCGSRASGRSLTFYPSRSHQGGFIALLRKQRDTQV